ncbi:hypothetical protein Hamer_G009753 [Homarus americanus]|uniref:Uncharacterized protein n=1 Tax=Homarus americanus TaxID=6706 RepID=A0A8J5N9W6_HOMAM|nr:hypothetical protein Hamer_G009753 [Homarus americanus]
MKACVLVTGVGWITIPRPPPSLLLVVTAEARPSKGCPPIFMFPQPRLTFAQVSIAFVFGLIGLLSQIDTDPKTWEATEFATIYASPDQMERFITNPDSVEKWFRWVSFFKAADSRPLGVGKKYQAIYNVPVFGEYVNLFKLVEYKPNKLVAVESSSFLKPRFTVKMEEGGPKTTRLTLKLKYRRSSALFQWTLGPVLWLVTSQQLQHSLFMLRMMFPF